MHEDSFRRQLHLRHPNGFDDAMFARFLSGCRLFRLHVETVLEEWARLSVSDDEGVSGEYVFEEPARSPDFTIVSLAISGKWTLGSRAKFENGASYLLAEFLPATFKQDLEEGLSERITGETMTSWRRPAEDLRKLLAAQIPFSVEDK